MSKFQCSQETQDKVVIFEAADRVYKDAWEQFEKEMELRLITLDRLRENRNAKLDDAKRALRTEAVEADITQIKLIKAGPFSVQKKWSQFYLPERTVAILKAKGLYDAAISAKVVAEKIELAKYEEFKQFLDKAGVVKDFEECEDGQELTPAVSGPKPIPPFGAEQKDSK
jgi:hypothetical protein